MPAPRCPRSIPACAGEPRCAGSWGSLASVYPRVCGGTYTFNRKTVGGAGLSPRVRGNHQFGPLVVVCHRSIPACAGEPWMFAVVIVGPPVYPRVCGGTGVGSSLTAASIGLSPRVRGNPGAFGSGAAPLGSIPACAGEPTSGSWSSSRGRVYPRVCGGTSTSKSIPTRAEPGGLSPRVRGNPTCDPCPGFRKRSIPACAGEPRGRFYRERHRGVYPRVCGGTSVRIRVVPRYTGLSPRVRGNHDPGVPVGCSVCLIRIARGDDAGVYPRVCGGTADSGPYSHTWKGLSPRVRGNPLPSESCHSTPGSIPACAGEPQERIPSCPTTRVYPRVCGGTADEIERYTNANGLSPRVRGNRLIAAK